MRGGVGDFTKRYERYAFHPFRRAFARHLPHQGEGGLGLLFEHSCPGLADLRRIVVVEQH